MSTTVPWCGRAADVVQDSFVALQGAWSRLGDTEKTHVYLYRLIVNRSRSLRRHWAVNDPNAPEPAPDAPGAGQDAIGDLRREAWVCALRALPDRQREAIVLRKYMGLSEGKAAEAMSISIGAVGSHLARGMEALRRLPGPP